MEFCYYCGGKPDQKVEIDGEERWICESCYKFWESDRGRKLLPKYYIEPKGRVEFRSFDIGKKMIRSDEKIPDFCYFCGKKTSYRLKTPGKGAETWKEIWKDIRDSQLGKKELIFDMPLVTAEETVKFPYASTIGICKECWEKYKPPGKIEME